MNPVLNISDLHLGIQQKRKYLPILQGVDLRIKPGQIHGLVGESGAGKSMIARAVLSILPGSTSIRSGSIRFKDIDLIGLPPKERRLLASKHIAMIPQDPMTSLNPVRRIGKQICDVLRLDAKLEKKVAEEQALQLLQDVRIREPQRVMRQYPFEISGGMQQRVLIAIAFACKPELIIADEPTTALDVTVQRQILQLINLLQSESGTALLFISHDLGVVAKICDFVSVIDEGRIIERQSVETLFDNPQHDYTRKLFETTAHYYSMDELAPPSSHCA